MVTPQRPSFIAHWSEIERPDDRHYDEDDELMSIGAPFGRHFGLTKLGIHHERLPPGRRTSFPHAESAEEEFVYVIEGEPEVWIDGHLHRLRPGDAVGFPAARGSRIASSTTRKLRSTCSWWVNGTNLRTAFSILSIPTAECCTTIGGTLIRRMPLVLTMGCRTWCAPRRLGEKPTRFVQGRKPHFLGNQTSDFHR
jgi:mannose-6-phosphate isomerase-like protein (cupin superfamily)